MSASGRAAVDRRLRTTPLPPLPGFVIEHAKDALERLARDGDLPQHPSYWPKIAIRLARHIQALEQVIPSRQRYAIEDAEIAMTCVADVAPDPFVWRDW